MENESESIEIFLKEHTKETIAKRLRKKPSPSYLKDMVYGAVDGIITTFAGSVIAIPSLFFQHHSYSVEFLNCRCLKKLVYPKNKWLFSALEKLLVGFVAASISFFIGWILGNIV